MRFASMRWNHSLCRMSGSPASGENFGDRKRSAESRPADRTTLCESALEFDPFFLRQFNELPRRSAFGPHAE
jgi:hypothetical protein